MTGFEPRSLHLHTLDSLISDLVSGRPILIKDAEQFSLTNKGTRALLQWYQIQGAARWSASLNTEACERIVDAAHGEPKEMPPLATRPENASTKRLRLIKLEAHRFAGLHVFGTPAEAPANYVHDFVSAVTLFEGRNGSGKTSLANAIIWALTGLIIRPERAPEGTDDDFTCVIEGVGENSPSEHSITAITPLPDVALYRPAENTIPTDTWVELTFEDENGLVLPPVRRSQGRTVRGKATEESNVEWLGVDPVGLRIGTLMPALLGLIKVGTESEMGKAVAELTGLSALADLANNCRRAKAKIDGDLTTAKTRDISQTDSVYRTAKADLETGIKSNHLQKPPIDVPEPSKDATIEEALNAIAAHFTAQQSKAFESAKSILGIGFEPTNEKSKAGLASNIAPALHELTQIGRLPSVSRMAGLKALTKEQCENVRLQISEIVREGQELEKLAQNPTTAARSRLYARIAAWMDDHPDPTRDVDRCVSCGGTLVDVVDPVTGQPVKTHLVEAQRDKAFISQTIVQWGQFALNGLTAGLPEALQKEVRGRLPDHPCDLLRTGLLDELFEQDPFVGELAALKSGTATAFDGLAATRTEMPEAQEFSVPPECKGLQEVLVRLEKALRFADWRRENDALLQSISEQVIGKKPLDGEEPEKSTLSGKLRDLSVTVQNAEPLTNAITQCGRLKDQMKRRRDFEKRLAAYASASDALATIQALGSLADQQVDELRSKLGAEAAKWRSKIYQGAFPTITHELVGTGLGRRGELSLQMRAGGVSAPAQHITNASALRASLIGFYLAFWEYVLKERGGLKLLVFDDPQDLLDDENGDRLAKTLTTALVRAGGQVVMTTYNGRFANSAARSNAPGGVEHLEVLPATKIRPTIVTSPPRTELIARKEKYELDLDNEEAARNYADACRVFLENKLSDVFEDAGFSTWVKDNPHPALSAYVSRLRTQINTASSTAMFALKTFAEFVNHPAMSDNSDVLQLMNKSHHGKRLEIRAGDVAPHVSHLDKLTALAEQMWDECRRWRSRDALPADEDGLSAIALQPPVDLQAMRQPKLTVFVCPNLAAFTDHAPEGESQEQVLPLDPSILEGKVAFYLKRDNFGFAAPAGSIALVDATASAVNDRRLVVARCGDRVLARRLIRAEGNDGIGLTAETLDPRVRTPKSVLVRETEVALHQVAGIIFDHKLTVSTNGNDEAVEVDVEKTLTSIQVAFRVEDESAVPLALPKQVVLGSYTIPLDELGRHLGCLVALYLSDGSSIFKRVGDALPGNLSHLRQFESIGGLGSSKILSIGTDHPGMPAVRRARLIFGVLYNA